MFINKTIEYVDIYYTDTIRTKLLINDILAWSQDDLGSANVLTRLSFEITDNSPIYHRVPRMKPKHSKLIEKEARKVLEEGIIVPASSALLFLVVIATKKRQVEILCRLPRFEPGC